MTDLMIGEKLRAAREAKGFSQQEVSRALCLSVEIIDALERDAHHALPGEVFVRGYLRNYANFLKLNLFQDTYKASYVSVPTSHHTLYLLRLAGSIFLKILNYAVIIVLIALVFIWWHDRHHAQDEEISLGKSTFNSLHSGNE